MKELFDRVKSVPILDVLETFLPQVNLTGRQKHRVGFCPFHDDKNTPNFSVNTERNFFKCFACGVKGSNLDLILRAGLASTPLEAAQLIGERFGIPIESRSKRKGKLLTLNDYAAYVNVPAEYLGNEFQITENKSGLHMPYFDEKGKQVGVQIRHRLEKGRRKDARFSWKPGSSMYLYNAQKLSHWRNQGVERIYVVEGCSDTHVNSYSSIPTVAAPGANAFRKEWAKLIFPFPTIGIVQEPGDAGERFVKSIAAALRDENYRGQLKAVSLPEKDPRELWLKHTQDFKRLLEEATAAASVIDLYPRIPSTHEVIYTIANLLKRHVVFKDERLALLIATWITGTYVHDIFAFYGYLWINSPVKRCGKSLLEDLLSKLCWQATPRLTNLTEAVLFRLAHTGRTLILDEIENLKASDKDKYGAIMSVLNGGFQSGSTVPRNEKSQGGFKIVEFNVYGPKILAGISSVIDTIEDRSFKIPMVRKAPTEYVERFNLRKQGKELAQLRQSLGIWAEAKRKEVEEIYDAIDGVEMGSLDDRFQDITEPLAAIAALADAQLSNGGSRVWPELRSLLLEMAGKRGESARQEGIAVFAELVAEALDEAESIFISTADLLKRASETEGLTWIGSAKALATFLGKFDLTSRRDSAGKSRGYRITRQWLSDVQNRYSVALPAFEASEASESRSGCDSGGIL